MEQHRQRRPLLSPGVGLLVGSLLAFGCDPERAQLELRDGEPPEDEPSSGFLSQPDLGGGVPSGCSEYTQDCPAGHRCAPYRKGGSLTWNTNGCFPIVAEPAGPGESCELSDDASGYLDDCERGSVCWDWDRWAGQGTCVPLALREDADPRCGDPMTTEAIIHRRWWLCVPRCDPLDASTCPQQQACYPLRDEFGCVPDGSGDSGAPGDPCEYINACDPGSACIGAAAALDCPAGSCCLPFCDLTDPECPPGLACEPWLPDGGSASPLDHDVGICIAPEAG